MSGRAASAATIDVVSEGEAAVLTVSGLIDERFAGFGEVGTFRTMVINVSKMTRMTSFGVRQWIRAMDGLSKSNDDVYLLGCPTFFVDQLNMVLNFGGTGKVLTAVAPYTCATCGAESGELLDVLANRATLAKEPPERECPKCGEILEFDETPESYFAFVSKYGANTIQPAAAQLLQAKGLYGTVAKGATPSLPPLAETPRASSTSISPATLPFGPATLNEASQTPPRNPDRHHPVSAEFPVVKKAKAEEGKPQVATSQERKSQEFPPVSRVAPPTSVPSAARHRLPQHRTKQDLLLNILIAAAVVGLLAIGVYFVASSM